MSFVGEFSHILVNKLILNVTYKPGTGPLIVTLTRNGQNAVLSHQSTTMEEISRPILPLKE